MKAQEVLRRYAAGERNFRNTNIQGMNFAGQDLRGADFSGADIRSANFTDAKLSDSDFTAAKCGVQKRWICLQFVLMTILSILAGMIQVFVGAFTFTLANKGITEGYVAAFVFLGFLASSFVILAWRGLTIKTLSITIVIATCTLTAIASFGSGKIITGAFGGIIPVSDLIATAGALACALAVSFTAALTGAFIFISVLTFVASIIAANMVTFVLAVIASSDQNISTLTIFLSAVVFACISSSLSFFSSQKALQEHRDFLVVRQFGLSLGTLGGTLFCGADLSRVSFSQTNPRSTNFSNSQQHNTNCTHVCWKGCHQLSHARIGDTILKDPRVRTLLVVAEKGYKQNQIIIIINTLFHVDLKKKTLQNLLNKN